MAILDWKSHRAYQLTRPSRTGLEAMASEIAPGSHATGVTRLGGGLATATHAVDLVTESRGVLRLVLKRYEPDDETIRPEWDRLRFVQRLPLATPEPVAVDTKGRWFGVPALVMQRLSGRPLVGPADVDPWLRQIASTLLAIQDCPTGRVPAVVKRAHMVEKWSPPMKLKRGELVSKAIDVVERGLPSALRTSERAFGHGDFHPGNLLWSRRRLSGIVDWSNARIGPRAYEVAYCRSDLAVLFGADVSDRFLRFYQEQFGSNLGEDLAVWDLICALSALNWGATWVTAYREQGRRDLKASHVWPRAAEIIRRALRRI